MPNSGPVGFQPAGMSGIGGLQGKVMGVAGLFIQAAFLHGALPCFWSSKTSRDPTRLPPPSEPHTVSIYFFLGVSGLGFSLGCSVWGLVFRV